MLNGLVLVTEDTLFTSIPIAFRKVIFGENYFSTKIPRKDFNLEWNLHLPNLMIIINWHIGM